MDTMWITIGNNKFIIFLIIGCSDNHIFSRNILCVHYIFYVVHCNCWPKFVSRHLSYIVRKCTLSEF